METVFPTPAAKNIKAAAPQSNFHGLTPSARSQTPGLKRRSKAKQPKLAKDRARRGPGNRHQHPRGRSGEPGALEQTPHPAPRIAERNGQHDRSQKPWPRPDVSSPRRAPPLDQRKAKRSQPAKELPPHRVAHGGPPGAPQSPGTAPEQQQSWQFSFLAVGSG
ncbi:hypothetical protein LSM04_005703 [Trypanosoma melophagium]|uniref:uncharacterized protein n=1 Tax=Trypanosoma melophagium TaxID=715481 RepID=UPI00351A2330|nr:hypothetical protein LSM04_005703 [Trypanosoma melophagium]